MFLLSSDSLNSPFKSVPDFTQTILFHNHREFFTPFFLTDAAIDKNVE